MRLKLYRAASVKEAMALVRAELGPDALILSDRRIAEGVELTAALETGEEITAPQAAPEPRWLDCAFHGIEPGLAARLSAPNLEAALAAQLQFGALPLRAGQRLILIGLPGAGKTLSIARLATRLVLAGQPPLVITADGRRAGAAEELAAYTRLLGLNLMVASTEATLARALASPAARSGAPVLIDTSGVNPFAPAELGALESLLLVAGATPVLVMAAGQDGGEAVEQAACFAPLGVRHMLPTRLDMARRLGGVINAAAASGLILTEASIGSGMTDALVEITPHFLAERLLNTPARQARPGQAPPLPRPDPEQPAPRLRTPVFPSARARAAELWSNDLNG